MEVTHGRRPAGALRTLAIALVLTGLAACGGDDTKDTALSDPPIARDSAAPVTVELPDVPLPPASSPPHTEPAVGPEKKIEAATPDWERYWTKRLAGVPRLFAVDYIQPDQMVAGDGQEAVIAKYPLVITGQIGHGPSTRRAHLDTIRDLNPEIILLAYLDPLEEQGPEARGPGVDAMEHLKSNESAYLHDRHGNRLYISHPMATRALYDPRSLAVRGAVYAAIEAILEAYPYDGIFLDNYTLTGAMVLTDSGEKYRPGGEPRSEADYASKFQAMTIITEEIRKRWPDKLFIGNSGNVFPALHGEMVEGTAQFHRFPVQAAEHPLRQGPFMPLFMDFGRSSASDPGIANRMAEVHALGGWYGVALGNYRKVLWPAVFDY